MIQNVCIFFTVVLIVISVVLMIITRWYIELCQPYESEDSESESRIAALISEKDKLILDSISLQERNDELYDENVRLSDAIKELREINKEHVSVEVEQKKKYFPDSLPTNMFRCEPYKFAKNSQQAMLQEECFTDEETGIRCWYDNEGCKFYCAALAGAYGIEIGKCYIFTLANGEVIPVIQADFKHPIDNVCDDDYGDIDKNYDNETCLSVIEFVVDIERIPERVRQTGTMSALKRFGGISGHGSNIVNVVELERKWRP